MSFNYKPFVEILPEKADAWRNFCICVACKDINGHQDTLLKKFPFKTERIRTHLKKCEYFKNKYPEMYTVFFEAETVDNIENSRKRLRRKSTSSAYSSISRTSMYIILFINNI